MDNHIPELKTDDEVLFSKLVLEGLTLAAIRREMSSTLDEFGDIPLIKKMLQIFQQQGEG